MPTYFVGNVLPSDKDAVPEGDSTFDFTHEEAASMNLTVFQFVWSMKMVYRWARRFVIGQRRMGQSGWWVV